MLRTITITVPADKTDDLINALKEQRRNYLQLIVQRGISLEPPGDIVTIEVSNRALHQIINLLASFGIPAITNSSLKTNRPLSLVSKPFYQNLTTGGSEMTWEELEMEIGRESNMTINALIIMFTSGVLSAIGISTNTLHFVIAGMLIAPGFEPFSRIALGAIAHNKSSKRGALCVIAGYLALSAGALLTAFLIKVLGQPVFDSQSTFFPPETLVNFWTNITVSSLIVSILASFAGALLIISSRTILTSGVMVALALVPSITIAAMSLISGNMGLFTAAISRWIIDVILVTALSAAAFYWKRASVLKRQSLLLD